MLRLKPSLVAVGLFASIVAPLSAEDISADLESFGKKLQEATAAQREDPSYGRGVSGQLGALQIAIKKGDFRRAQQMLENIGQYGMPPALQESWQSLADKLATEIDEKQQKAVVEWKKSVDELAARTKKACLEAKSSDDLDAIMVEIAALQMKRLQTDNILAQRANQKLEGIARFIEAWCHILDYKAAGEGRQANNLLRNLIQNGSDFPILTQDQLKEEISLEKTAPDNAQDIARQSFAEVKSVNDLPKAVEKLEGMLKNPSPNGGPSWNAKDALLLVTADQQVEANELPGAEQSLRQLDSSNLYQNSTQWLQPIRDEVTRKLIARKLEKVTGTKLKAEESPAKMLSRVLDELLAQGKYAEMATIITEASKAAGNRSGALEFPWTGADSTALLYYSSASQFEKAGDTLAAINDYRRVISQGQGGKYAPTADAQKALERLKASNPQAFADVNAVVLEEIRQLRQELNQMYRVQRNMPPGMGR